MPCFYCDATFLLLCHTFTIMPCFYYDAILHTTISTIHLTYLHLTYLLRLQPQNSPPNHKSHLYKNLNI